MHAYTKAFFEKHHSECDGSSERMVPLLLSLFKPKSILDVGCGDGTWLSKFASQSVQDYVGVDGDYVSSQILQIPTDHFIGHDLSKPLDLKRKFDLVMSLEVAEHLSEQAAHIFVRSLTCHGDLILFSAAIPGQFGDHHVNEQWPSYWVSLFEKCGFKVFDILRWRIWNDPKVTWYYRQNMLVFATPERASTIPALCEEGIGQRIFPLDIAHPIFVNFFRYTLRTDASIRLLAVKLMKLSIRRLFPMFRKK
jgi:SAM-dependent methyltransferase